MSYLEELLPLLAKQSDRAIVATLDPGLAAALGSETRFVVLSSSTVFKQAANHSELKASEYMVLPRLLSDGLVLLESGPEPRLHFLLQHTEKERYVATLKRTRDRTRLYVVRFHRARRRYTKALLKKSVVLRNHK